MPEQLKVSRIHIRNILGIEDLDVRPGALTIVEGANGVGKTSVLEAIKSLIGGGHDATLIRNGAKSGQVVMELSDGVTVTKSIRESGSSVSVIHPEHGELRSPQGYINKLVDALGYNPVAFLVAEPKKRIEYLLESMPLRIQPEEIKEALGAAVEDVPEIWWEPSKDHALPVIDRIRTAAYDARTGINREAKGKRATAEQLRASLPESGLQAEPGAANALRETAAELRAEMLRRQRDIESDRDAKIEEVKRRAQMEIDQLRTVATEALNTVREEIAPRLEQLAAEAAAADERLRASAQAENTRRILDEQQADAEQLEVRSGRLTDALERLDELKLSLSSRLAIPGASIDDGQLLVDGIPFDRLNTAKQVQVAMQIAAARAKASGLPLVCVDGLERLDAKTFEAFRAKAPKSGLQLVVTRVGDGDLTVTPIPAEVAA